MESHPTSIVIAQAILESGWGTSKFFQKANNIFGVWSFSKSDNRIAASKKRGDKTVYLKKYKSMEESIYDYFVILSRKDCYKLFQKERLITQDPYKLVNYLIKYSERGESYTKDLKDMIRRNRLFAYDGYQLDL
jgi:Bax protein